MHDPISILIAAVRLYGASAVGRVMEMPAGTITSIVAGTAREGSKALAAQRIGRLDRLVDRENGGLRTAS